MEFVKYINENTIEKAPSIIFEEKVYIANPTEEIYRAHDYKPLYEGEYPELGENEYAEPFYSEEEDRIVLSWTVKEYEEVENG